ncbi:hypothetical protein BUALT_Bualt15G0082100 [Buddleja alternifolia]|uniref:Cupin type-1 domain-containing protein n=1 Tax=Buddleja alternifolia TaxID=168488 RepID=A0AAV6WF11_9LAMI|nr:hypothetical protein BUALT_Bualt15G0082100 [Buddleja alternifolia]
MSLITPILTTNTYTSMIIPTNSCCFFPIKRNYFFISLQILLYIIAINGVELAPQMADTTLFEGEGGGYYAWTSPALAEWRLGAGKLVLQPRGFAMPHYSDSAKIGYVIQGTCTVGVVSPNSPNENILIIKKGDAMLVPMGTLSWWFNGGDHLDAIIVFLGETSQSYNPGQIEYFALTGAIGFLQGFSSEFITKIYNISEQDSIKLAKSQTNGFILKLDDQIRIPDDDSNSNKEKYVFSLDNLISSNVNAEITADDFPLLEKIGLSASLMRLEPNSALGPSYSTDASNRIFYVIKGSGTIQIVGLNGTQILDAKLQQDQLFVVPKFFAIAQLAGDEGLEFFSVITSSRPVIGQLFGNLSAWNALSSSVLQASLNVDSHFVEFFKSNNGGDNHNF